MEKRKGFFGANHAQSKISRTHKTITIGVLGTNRGVGASHVSFLLATYFNKLKNKVAIVEMNNNDTFTYIEKAYEGKNFKGVSSEFAIKYRHFYKNFNGVLSDVKNKDFSIVIVDYGAYGNRYPKGFEDMDIKLVIGHANEWRLHEFDQFIGFSPIWLKSIICVINLGNKEESKLFHREYGREGKTVPYLKDPFLWTKKLSETVEAMIGM